MNTLGRKSSSKGFTLLELIVVLAGLGILASLAVPNIIKYLTYAQIDEAKSLLNVAAAECLQKLRNSSDASWKKEQPNVLKALKGVGDGALPALPGNYQYQDDHNTCEEVQIYDPAGNDTLFVMLRFRIDESGRVYKDSQYFNDDTKKDCETWGNCGGSESADYLINCKAEKATCETNYSTFVETRGDGGPDNIGKWQGSCKWPKDPIAGCPAVQTWVFEKRALYSQADYDKAYEDRFGRQCIEAKQNAINGFVPAGEGIVNLPDCRLYERYYKGNKLTCNNQTDCDIAYAAAEEEERQRRCSAAYNAWVNGNANGKFTEAGCEAKWKCGTTIYSDQTSYNNDRVCNPPAPTPAPAPSPSPAASPRPSPRPSPSPSPAPTPTPSRRTCPGRFGPMPC